MQCTKLFDTLQNLTNIRPSITRIADVTEIPVKTWYARVQRNSEVPYEEIEKIEDFYGISILGGDKNTVELDYYPDVYGSCGFGAMVYDEAPEKISVTKNLINNYSTAEKYTVINARGLSMAPLIMDMDKLIVRHFNGEQIVDNDVYVFNYKGELFIKRLVKNIDQIICISENPRFEDRPITPDANNFRIIGKVVGLFREKV